MPVRLAVRDGQRADLLASILARLHLNSGQIFNAARGATVTRRVWASWSVVLLLCLAVILVHGDGWVQNRIHDRGSVTLLMNVKDRPNIITSDSMALACRPSYAVCLVLTPAISPDLSPPA